MDKAEFLHMLTLWFAVLVFLQTGSGTSGGPVLTIIAIIALILTYLLPLYLLIGVGAKLVSN